LAELERRKKPKTNEPENCLGKRKGKEREAESVTEGEAEAGSTASATWGRAHVSTRRADGGGEGPQERKWMRVE